MAWLTTSRDHILGENSQCVIIKVKSTLNIIMSALETLRLCNKDGLFYLLLIPLFHQNLCSYHFSSLETSVIELKLYYSVWSVLCTIQVIGCEIISEMTYNVSPMKRSQT